VSDPLVSLIIPAYNGAKYLREALESAVGQTYSNMEVIVVDDGSTDDSAEIAESFVGVRVLRQPNAGVAAARNRAIETAEGDYLAFLDQDDIHHPAKTERQFAALKEHPEAGLALCQQHYLIQGEPPKWFRGPLDGSPVNGFVPSCWLVRRETFEKVGPFDQAFTNGPDYDWLARAKDMGTIWITVPEALVTYRIHGANESGNAHIVRQEMLRFLRGSLQRRRGAPEGTKPSPSSSPHSTPPCSLETHS
jgi:glycosyltransferase involved in cell wall biosynthesis